VYRNFLNAVDEIAPDDVWASGPRAPVRERVVGRRHWDGSAWTAYGAGGSGTRPRSGGVTHFAPDDVRMVGVIPSRERHAGAHWDAPRLLDAVPFLPPSRIGRLSATSVIGGQLWAVGEMVSATTFANLRALAARRCPGE
jgi:hypothetical protein